MPPSHDSVRVRDPGLARVLTHVKSEGPISPETVTSLLQAAAKSALPGEAVADELARIRDHFGPDRLRPQDWQRLERAIGAESVGAPPPTRTRDVHRTTTVRGPEEPAKPGDIIRGPRLTLTPEQVLEAAARFDARAARDPAWVTRLRAQPFPATARAQLDWALAYEQRWPKTDDPLWSTATNDGRAALVNHVQGLRAASAQGFSLGGDIEGEVVAAQTRFWSRPLAGDAGPFPANGTREQQLDWAFAVGGSGMTWDPELLPEVQASPLGRALVHLVDGVLGKRNQETGTPVLSERRVLEVDGDVRVYAVHTPPGERPAAGWPTVFLFHGSYGGYAPEQMESYQQILALADAHGYQVVFPVGTPQDRSDESQTGRGMLNWDPVGAGPSGKNDRFVFELSKALVESGDLDRTRTFVAGHSQGGFYVSGLMGSYPEAFAGAAIFGAGAGTVASTTDFSRLSRKTPLLLMTNQEDVHHLPSAQALAQQLQASGFGDALSFVSLPGRGHEVTVDDYRRMFERFDRTAPFEGSRLGALDGKSAHGQGAQPPPTGASPFRTELDLRNPPPALAQDAEALWTIQALKDNPFLNLDGVSERFGLEEWKAALFYLHTFPQWMQTRIAALRAHFVQGPPPSDGLDVTALPRGLLADPAVRLTLDWLMRDPALDLDGYPGVLTARELSAARALGAGGLGPQLESGLATLEALLSTPPPTPGERTWRKLERGARLLSYPGSEAAIARLEEVFDGLSKNPRVRALLGRIDVVLSPPGHGLDAVPEIGPDYANAEGVAALEGFPGLTQGPTLSLRTDSIERWNLGAVHELLHLLEQDLGPEVTAQLEAVWHEMGFPPEPWTHYPNPSEMLAYFGQWYASGFGDVLKDLAPPIHVVCARIIGDARVEGLGLTEQDARVAMMGLLDYHRNPRPL